MSLSAINDNGKPVDWWFIYKLPDNATSPLGVEPKSKKTSGYEYLYYDADSTTPLALSPNTLDSNTGALFDTLNQLYSNSADLGRIFYNDEIPGKGSCLTHGHTKGVLAFDPVTNTAFWLLHSTPRFPLTDNANFPEDEHIYGQTYLCVTLKDVATADAIAAQMYCQQQPDTYGCIMPTNGGDPTTWQNLLKLSQGVDLRSDAPPVDLPFQSAAGKNFRLLAKNKSWHKDFWIDLVGPKLGVDLEVETWRRGTVPPTEDSNNKDDVEDVLYINLEGLGIPYEWHYTKDHSKLAVSIGPDWVCVADLNRDLKQEKRGGGSICFQNQGLCDGLSKIEKFKA